MSLFTKKTLELLKSTVFLLPLFIFSLFLLSPQALHAAEDDPFGGTDPNAGVAINLNNYYKLNNGQSVSDVFSKPADMVNLIVSLLFTGAGLVLFFMIIIAGFGMIKGDSKEAEKAKSSITTAVIGFVVMFASYWIIQILELVTGVQILF